MSTLSVEPEPVVPASEEPTEAPLALVNHVSLPVHVPNMAGISNQELNSIRSHIQFLGRDARKKANMVIGKIATLRPLWMNTVSLGTRASPETRTEVMGAFEHELLRHPTAFVSYAMANSLAALDSALMDEVVRRTKLEPPKLAKKK